MRSILTAKKTPSSWNIFRRFSADEQRLEHVPGREQNKLQVIRKERRRVEREAVKVRSAVIGSGNVTWIAGPSFVQSVQQMLETAGSLKELGAHFIRARAYWPKARHEDVHRFLLSGLQVLRSAARHFDLNVVSEIAAPQDLPLLFKYCDVIEIGPDNAANVRLLRELSFVEKTVILNRHPLMSADYFLSLVGYLEKGGRCKIVLAENGARSIDAFSPSLLDLSTIVTLRRLTSHPILVDCSAYDPSYTEHLAIAAIAAGADGILAEVAGQHGNDGLSMHELKGVMERADALKYTLNALNHQRCFGNER